MVVINKSYHTQKGWAASADTLTARETNVLEVHVSQSQFTTCPFCSVLTARERQTALAHIALDRGLINANDYHALTAFPPSYDLAEMLFDLLTGQPGALVFVLRAVQRGAS